MPKAFERFRALLPPKLASALDFEIGTYRSFWQLFAHRKSLNEKLNNQTAFSYGEMQNGILWMFQFATISELIAIEFLVSNETLKIILLVLGIWSIVLIIGIWASMKTHLHEVDDQYLYIRHGSLYEIKVPKTQILDLKSMTSREFSKCKKDGMVLHLPVMNETNALVILNKPLESELPWGMTGPVSEVWFYVNKGSSSIPVLKSLIN